MAVNIEAFEEGVVTELTDYKSRVKTAINGSATWNAQPPTTPALPTPVLPTLPDFDNLDEEV
jgi:hypothetical protein